MPKLSPSLTVLLFFVAQRSGDWEQVLSELLEPQGYPTLLTTCRHTGNACVCTEEWLVAQLLEAYAAVALLGNLLCPHSCGPNKHVALRNLHCYTEGLSMRLAAGEIHDL